MANVPVKFPDFSRAIKRFFETFGHIANVHYAKQKWPHRRAA